MNTCSGSDETQQDVSREAMYLVTYACDKSCSYCFNDLFYYKRKTRPHLKDYKLLAQKLVAMNVRKVYITGGEAALHPQIAQILEEFAAHEFEVTLFTNGYLFKRFSPERIEQFGLRAINISIDPFIGAQFEHTYRDQDDSFIPDLQAFYTITRKTKISILVTVTTDNLKLLPGFLHIDYIKSADRVLFQPLSVPSHDPLFKVSFDSIPTTEVSDYLSQLLMFTEESYKSHLSILERYYEDKSLLPPCQMGKRYLQIDPDGSVFGCPHNKSVIVAQNILEEPAERIMSRLDQAHENEFCTNRCLESKCLGTYSHLVRRYILEQLSQ
jgi:MoaA/NifB/PqqE/SkfB family radical SAM enzyme